MHWHPRFCSAAPHCRNYPLRNAWRRREKTRLVLVLIGVADGRNAGSMRRSTALGSNDNALPLAGPRHASWEYPSEARLRLKPPLNSDVSAALPDPLLDWLHDGMDRHAEEPSEARSLERCFENTLIDRLFPVYDTRTFVIRMRDHSRATAMAARVVSERASLRCSGRAFVVGWLHDMGLASLLVQLDPSAFESENEAFDQVWPGLLGQASHAAVSLATAWRLPSAIRYAVREHMSFSSIHPTHELAATTFIAEHLAGCMGCSFRDEQPTSGLRFALSRLQLCERDLISLGRSAERMLTREAWYWMGALPCAGA